MATSGSVDYSVDRDEIITESLELLGILGEGESPSAAQLTSSARTLNLMVKGWQNRVHNLHVIQDLYLFPVANQTKYEISGTSSDKYGSELVKTAVATAQTSGNNTLVVDSITGIANGDNIGIELDDGTRQYTTVNGAPSGSTVTLTANLTDDVAVDNTVVVWTTTNNVPVKADHAWVTDIATPATPVDTPIRLINRSDYTNFSNKTTTGRPTELWIDYQRSSWYVHVWPAPSSIDDVIGLKVWRRLEDFDTATDDADFPQWWYHALALKLAVHLAPKYGYPTRGGEMNNLKMLAEEAMFDAESYEVEESVFLMPDLSRNYP